MLSKSVSRLFNVPSISGSVRIFYALKITSRPSRRLARRDTKRSVVRSANPISTLNSSVGSTTTNLFCLYCVSVYSVRSLIWPSRVSIVLILFAGRVYIHLKGFWDGAQPRPDQSY